MKIPLLDRHTVRAPRVRSHTSATCCALAVVIFAAAVAADQPAAPEPLRNAAAVRALSQAAVASHRAVKMRGVVMYVDRTGSRLFTHDGTTGIRVGDVARFEEIFNRGRAMREGLK